MMNANSTPSRTTFDPSLPAISVVLPTLALLSCLLSIPPLLSHVHARNFAATVMVFGFLVLNFRNFLNAVIWPRDASIKHWKGEGLCDIEVKLDIGLTGAIFGATVCIFRQLAIILDTNKPTITLSKSQKYTSWIIEGTLCIGIPVYLMSIHYVVQFQRYWLFTTYGCAQTYSNSWLSVVLMFIWPPILCTIGSVYCGIATVRLLKYRRSISTILSSSSSITKARYIRLFSLASVSLLVYFPLSIYTLIKDVQQGMHPYSWSNVHNWHPSIRVFTSRGNHIYSGFDRWVQVGTGFVLFCFFGLGHDAVLMYRGWLLDLNSVAQRLDSYHSFRRWASTKFGSTSSSRNLQSCQSSATFGHKSTPVSPVDRELELLDNDYPVEASCSIMERS